MKFHSIQRLLSSFPCRPSANAPRTRRQRLLVDFLAAGMPLLATEGLAFDQGHSLASMRGPYFFVLGENEILFSHRVERVPSRSVLVLAFLFQKLIEPWTFGEPALVTLLQLLAIVV